MKKFLRHFYKFFIAYASNLLMFIIGAALYIVGAAFYGRFFPFKINSTLFVLATLAFTVVQLGARWIQDALEKRTKNAKPLSLDHHPVP